jgi:hypothetical protein
MHPRSPGFFSFWGKGGRAGIEFFDFLLFPSSSQCVPQDVPNSTTLLSHMLCPKLSSFILYSWAKGHALHLPTKSSILGSLQNFNCFFVMDQSKWLIAQKRKKGLTWRGAPDLIKMNKFLTYIPFVIFWMEKIILGFTKMSSWCYIVFPFLANCHQFFDFLKNIATTTKKKCGAILFSITKKHPITNGMDQKMLTIDLRIAILYFKPFVKWSHWRLSISPNCYIFVVKFSTCSLLISFVYCVQELTKLFF